VEDLLRHYPRRYARRGELTDLGALAEGEQVTVSAEVSRVSNRPMRGRKGSLLEVEVTDGTGRLTLTFFNQSWRQKELRPGRVGLFAGKVGSYRGRRQLAHPDYVLFADREQAEDAADAEEFLRDLVSVYPATAKVPSWTIGRCVRLALQQLDPEAVPDPVPDRVREANRLLPLGRALQLVHLPDSAADADSARRRLTFDEAWVVQVVLAQRRHLLAGLSAKPRPAAPEGLVELLHQQLPYPLTDGQRQVMAEIDADLAAPAPMHRLLQGEVGSGKTVVALQAMLRVVESGGQAALLAPTEVLAEQHLRSISALLGPLAQSGMLGGHERGTRVDLLTGSATAAQRRKVLARAAGGETGILIGTHALLSDPVQFAELGLVVVDEQHRFGVEQRAALSEKARPGERPHVLVMTATPIPRTIAMTVFGDLAVSTLRELPAGRAPIDTHVVPAERPAFVHRMWERIAEEVANGRQAYVVCPRIDDSEPDPAGESSWAAVHSVVDTAAELAEGPLAGLRIAALHGRMSPEEKESVMARFAGHDGDPLDVLVATTVIEVGVDVPNATVMAVLDADRFGVSQLHQLRGRVGRGGHPGICLLHTALPAEAPGRERLAAVAQTRDGFALAEVDLLQRREGDVLGAAQSGRRSSLRLLSVARDGEVIESARAAADLVVAEDPQLGGHPALADAVAQWAAEDLLGYVDKG
jgi:ATP-dependent DNA helicase RecG